MTESKAAKDLAAKGALEQEGQAMACERMKPCSRSPLRISMLASGTLSHQSSSARRRAYEGAAFCEPIRSKCTRGMIERESR